MSWNRRSRNVIIGVRLSIIGGQYWYFSLLETASFSPTLFSAILSDVRERGAPGAGAQFLCRQMNDRKSFKLCKSLFWLMKGVLGAGGGGQRRREFLLEDEIGFYPSL